MEAGVGLMKHCFVIGLAATIFLNPGSSHATNAAPASRLPEGDRAEHIALQGEIVQSAFPLGDDLSGRPAGTKYTAIVLDTPICIAPDNSEMFSMLEVEVPKKWLGHHVSIAGSLTYEGLFFDVQNIVDMQSQNAQPPSPSADPDKVSDPKLADVSCGWVLRPDRGTDDSITEHAVNHLEAFRDSGKLPEKYFWSACTMYEYVLAECRINPRATVLDAVNSLISKTKVGKDLPSIPRCGA
jgi:hypothetical protein